MNPSLLIRMIVLKVLLQLFSHDAIKVEDDIGGALDATTDPHASVKVKIARVAGLHVQVGAERVHLWIDGVHGSGLLQFLEDVTRTNAPAFTTDSDIGRRMIVGLENEVGFNVSGKILSHELFLLSAGNNLVLA